MVFVAARKNPHSASGKGGNDSISRVSGEWRAIPGKGESLRAIDDFAGLGREPMRH
jgi:hypothetical protein